MPGRVDWGTRDGNEIEAVVANLLYNKYGRAIRVRPGQGDFGIDVIVPTEGSAESWDVYQVKKYASNLNAGQKAKIVESFSRLLIGLVREGFPVNDWHLVTPLDPTVLNDLQGWFGGLPEAAITHARGLKSDPLTDAEEVVAREWIEAPGRKIEWQGLPFCDTLASEYWYVVDYYLYGGRDRIRAATDSIAGLLSGDLRARKSLVDEPGGGSAALLEPSEVVEHLTLLDSVLDTDPHFIYGHGVSPTMPEMENEPGLVAATVQSLPRDRWLFFKIYQRSAQSVEERPIPMHLEFSFEEGTPDHEAFQKWIKYGKPVEVPAKVSLDLPGGLGVEGEESLVSIPAPRECESYRLRMRVVNPEGASLAELEFMMQSTFAPNGAGAWVAGTDLSGALQSESFHEIGPGSTQSINFTLAALEGQVAAKVHPAVRFARHLESPNTIQLARSVGKFSDLVELSGSEGMVPPSVEDFIASLATIQTEANGVIRIPDLAEITNAEVKDIHRVARLIGGDISVGNWRRQEIEGIPPGSLEVGEHIQIQVDIPLRVEVGGIRHEVGTVEQTVLSAIVVEVDGVSAFIEPNLNNTIHERLVDKPQGGDVPAGKTPVRARKYPYTDSAPVGG